MGRLPPALDQDTQAIGAARPLRTRGERPRRYRAAEQRYELTPSKPIEFHLLPPESQHSGLASIKSGLAAVRDSNPAYDRVGSK